MLTGAAAALIAFVVAASVASGALGRPDLLGLSAVTVPAVFIMVFLVFFFYAWAPILTVALIVCAIVPALRRSAHGWIWASCCAVWIVSAVLCCYAVPWIRGSGALGRFYPF
ncbi:MAG TPA: hypothetical protein VH280_01615 [Verrucomicrobiae bacterium]|nr:hypothetical protein [Verrucomicrobiae bacterium]